MKNKESYNLAILYIKKSFLEEDGIIDKIEKGKEIGKIEIQMVESALSEIHASWLEQEVVPKQDVRLLWNVFPRLETCLSRYPQREEEITDFMVNVSMWIERLFTTSSMSEEQAIAVVSQHIIGPSFLVDLLLSHPVNEASQDELFFAIETLTHAWRRKEDISKLAAGALISTQFMTVPKTYSQTEIHHLQAIRQQLIQRITECLR